jgi:hypothetical protein
MSYNVIYARMMESVDMRDLKSLGRKAVRVQVPLCAPSIQNSAFCRVFVILKGVIKQRKITC